MFVPGKPFQPSLMFADKARSILHKSGMPVQTLVNYGRIKFYNIGSWLTFCRLDVLWPLVKKFYDHNLLLY